MPSILDSSAQPKNNIINGNFDFWQRGTSFNLNSANSVQQYSADRWASWIYGGTTQTINITASRTSTAPTSAQSGFQSQYAMQVVNNAAIASFSGASNYAVPFIYQMEGLDYQKLNLKTVTVGFWFASSVPGTYSFALTNGSGSRCYTTTFTVNSASTYEYKSIVVPLDTAGTYAADNSSALRIFIAALSGGGNATSTLNTWQANNFFSASTSTNWIGTAGATLAIAQVRLYEGSLVSDPKSFVRIGTTIQQEFALCQRYYEKSSSNNILFSTGTSVATNSYVVVTWPYAVTKRNPPSVIIYDRAGTAGAYSYLNPNTGVADGQTPINPSTTGTYGVTFDAAGNNSLSGVQFGFSADCEL